MPNKKIPATQEALRIAGRGDKSRYARAAATVAPVLAGGDTGKATLEVTTESRREESDRQAIERGEEDGLIVNQSVASIAHNRGDLNGISGR